MMRYISYQQIVDNIMDLIFIHDLLDGIVLQANRSVERILGYTNDEIIGMCIVDIIDPEYKDDIPRYLKDVQEKRSLEGFMKVISRDGGSYTMKYVSSVSTAADGTPVAYVIARDVTELKRKEEQLKKSEYTMKLMVETLPAAVFTVDTEKKVTSWNKEAERITGYTKDEILGESCMFFSIEPCVTSCGLFDHDGEKPLFGMECFIRRKDGQIRNVYKNIASLTDSEGIEIGGIESFIDVTEKVEMEKYYRELVENLNDIIFNIDFDGTITYISPVVETLMGFAQDQLVGKSFAEFVHPDDLPGLMESMTHTLSGKIEPYEFRIVNKDGKYIHFRSSSKMSYRNEEPTGLSGVLSNITRWKEAEAQVAESLHLMQELMNAIPTPLFYKDLEGKYLGYNKAFRDALGYGPDEMIGKTVFDLMPHDVAQGQYEKDQELYAQGQAQHYHSQIRYVDGSIHDVVVHKALFSGADGNIGGLIGVVFDITEQKLVEIELKHLNQQLIERAAELSLSNKEINRLKIMAEEANRSKSEFLANMSHEIRTPMNGILGFAELLLEEELTDEQEEAVRTIYNSGHALLNLINDILDLSKVESGMMEVHEEEFFLLDLLNSSMVLSRPQAVEKGLDYSLDIQTSIPPRVVGDQDKIRQILINLIGNAVKFTETGRVTVSIRMEENDSNESVLGIRVADTGPGIPAGKLESIFNPFTQVDASSTKKYAGTGLGLSITKKLVDMLKGDISVSSRLGEGSEFTVTVPVKVSMKQEEWSVGKASSEKILIVEDDPATMKLYQNYLERNGYKVVGTSFGRNTVNLAREHMPCLIILDIVLPDISGWQVLQHLKEDAKVGNIPVLIASVLSEKNKAISLGAIDYIKKPISGRQLVDRIKSMIQTKQDSVKARIVVVDDDKPVLEFLGEMLDEKGFEVVTFQDPKEAVAYLENEKTPDLVILDIFMPEMDGFDVMNAIKEKPHLQELPIIFVTGREMSDRQISKVTGITHTLLNKSTLTTELVLSEIRRNLAQQEPCASKKASPGKADERRTGETILVVEDNSANQKLMDKILTNAGYVVTIASNGEEALRAVADGWYDLILMDMHMPVMDGYEATRRLKGMEEYKHIPIVALTAQAMKGDEERVYEAGCDGYLTKPVKKQDLLNEIRRHLGKSTPREETESSSDEDNERNEIFKEYYATLPDEYAKIVDAAEREDFDRLFHVGHDLKGAAGAFGLHTVSMLGRRIEQAAKEKRIEHVRFAMEMLKEEIEMLNDNR